MATSIAGKAGVAVILFLAAIGLNATYNALTTPKTSEQLALEEVDRVEKRVQKFLNDVDYLCLDGVLYYERVVAHNTWFAPYVDKTTLTFVRCTDNVAP